MHGRIVRPLTTRRRIAAVAALALALASPGPVAAHSAGCVHEDHLFYHNGHYDYMDFWSHFNYLNHHWHRWNNATHDTFHDDDCGCVTTPCPLNGSLGSSELAP